MRERLAVLGAAAGFVLLSSVFLSRCFNASAFTYAVVADEGLSKPQEAAHPLYVPLLRAAAAVRRAAGFAGPSLELFQWLSLVGAAAFLCASWRLAYRFSGDAALSLWAALFLSLQPGPWTAAMLTKPYTWAAFSALVAVDLTEGGASGAKVAFWAAAAGSLDVLNIALIPCLAVRRRKEKGWLMSYAAVVAGFGAVYFAAVLRKTSAASLYFSPHLREDSILFNRAPLTLASHYWGTLQESAPGASFLLIPAAGVLAWGGGGERAAAALALGLFAAFSAVFASVDARNGYVYAALLGLPALLAAAGRSGVVRTVLPAATIAAAACAFAGSIWPLSIPTRESARSEAEFLTAHLNKGDVLAVAGAPDWRLAYLCRGGFELARFDGAEVYASPSLAVAPGAYDVVARALKNGKRVWLAADSLFRPEGVLPAKEIDEFQARFAGELGRRFTLGPARISPQGQYYFPITSPRPHRRP